MAKRNATVSTQPTRGKKKGRGITQHRIRSVGEKRSKYNSILYMIRSEEEQYTTQRKDGEKNHAVYTEGVDDMTKISHISYDTLICE